MRKFKYILLTIICVIPAILIAIGFIGTIDNQDIDKLPLFYSTCFVIGVPFEAFGLMMLFFNMASDY